MLIPLQTNLEITGETDFARLLQLEENYVQRMCADIIALKPDLVFTEKGVSGLSVCLSICVCLCLSVCLPSVSVCLSVCRLSLSVWNGYLLVAGLPTLLSLSFQTLPNIILSRAISLQFVESGNPTTTESQGMSPIATYCLSMSSTCTHTPLCTLHIQGLWGNYL